MTAPPSTSRTKIIRLLLGPSLISLAFAYFLYLLLNQISTTTIIALSTFLVGIILTSWETLTFLQREAIYAWNVVLEKINTIVLDDVLRAIFAVDSEGLVVGAMSAVVGTAGMYALPLTAEQRVRVTQSCLEFTLPTPSSSEGSDGVNNEAVVKMDAEVILTKPGGFLSVLPENWRLALQPSSESRGNFQNDDAREERDLLLLDNESSNRRTEEEEKKPHLDQNNGVVSVRDMTWDAGEDEGDTDSTSSTTAANTVDDGGSSITAASPPTASSTSTEEVSIALHRSRQQGSSPIIPNMPPTMPNTMNSNINVNDPFDVVVSILHEILADRIKYVLSNIDRRFIGAAGSTAVVALLAHLRYSRTARRTVAGLIHGSIALSLASAAAGCGIAFLAVSMQPLIERRSAFPGNTEGPESNGLETSTAENNGCRPTRRRNELDSFMTVGASKYGKSIATALYQITRGERYKRLRKVLVFIFIFYFHKRRQRRALTGAR